MDSNAAAAIMGVIGAMVLLFTLTFWPSTRFINTADESIMAEHRFQLKVCRIALSFGVLFIIPILVKLWMWLLFN